MTPSELLAAARDVLGHRDPIGGWARAVALLARQGLETGLEEFWATRPTTIQLRDCSRKAQFACLPFYLDPELAHETSYVWAALSNACHYHPFDLAPTAAELAGWIDDVARFLAAASGQMPVISEFKLPRAR